MYAIGRVAPLCLSLVAVGCSSGQEVARSPIVRITPLPAATSPPAPPPSPVPTPVEVIGERLTSGTHVSTPFAPPDGFGVCLSPLQVGCTETSADDTIRISFTVPDGWASGFGGAAITKPAAGTRAPSGMSLHFLRGGWLYTDPCVTGSNPPDIVVGPTVGEFADALADHPLLEVTAPVDITLGGYSGKYLDLEVPADITTCPESYYPWDPAFYAQGPNHRWHVWILDVDGVRVVIQSGDFAVTLPQDLVEMHAIIESIRIEP